MEQKYNARSSSVVGLIHTSSDVGNGEIGYRRSETTELLGRDVDEKQVPWQGGRAS